MNDLALVGLVGINLSLAWVLHDHQRTLERIESEVSEDA